MKLAEILNPWRVIRDLRVRNAYLEGRLDEVTERAEEAEERAFHRASDHYYQRSRMVEEQLKATQQRLVDIASLQPVFPKSVLATMNAEGHGG